MKRMGQLTGQCHFPVLQAGFAPGFSGSRFRCYGDPMSALTSKHQQLCGVSWLNAELSALGTTGGRVRAVLHGASVLTQTRAHFQRQTGWLRSQPWMPWTQYWLDFSFNQERETKQNKTPNSTHWCSAVFWILKHLSRIYNLSFPECRLWGLLWVNTQEIPITPSDQCNMECSTAVYSILKLYKNI